MSKAWEKVDSWTKNLSAGVIYDTAGDIKARYWFKHGVSCLASEIYCKRWPRIMLAWTGLKL